MLDRRNEVSASLYNLVDGIHQQYRVIQTVQIVEESFFAYSKEQNLLNARSRIQGSLREISAIIRNNVELVNLSFKREGEVSLESIIRGLLDEDKLFVIGEIIFSTVQLLLSKLSDKNYSEVHNIFSAVPNLVLRLYSLPPCQEREVLLRRLSNDVLTVKDYEKLEENKRLFCFKMEAITAFHEGVLTLDDLKQLSVEELNEILDFVKVIKLIRNLGREDALDVVAKAVDKESDLDAWLKVSPQQFSELVEIPCRCLHQYGGMTHGEIVALYLERPDDLRALSRSSVSTILKNSSIGEGVTQKLLELLITNKRKFNDITSGRILEAWNHFTFEEICGFYDADITKFLHLTSQTGILMCEGFGDARYVKRLYEEEPNCFFMLYSLGEGFLGCHSNQLRKLSETFLQNERVCPFSNVSLYQEIWRMRAEIRLEALKESVISPDLLHRLLHLLNNTHRDSGFSPSCQLLQ
jgi:hypothetical protein